jgi:hypothetical protein
MKSSHGDTGDAGRPRSRERGEAAAPAGGSAAATADQAWGPARRPGRHAAQGPPDRGRGQPGRTEAVDGERASGEPGTPVLGAEPVARRTATGWRVGDEEVSDLTSAMVLADLLAADLPGPGTPAAPAATAPSGDEPPDARRLEQTVAQLEHALTARVRVEQAIGVLAERHRLRPRQAFELLRSVARAQGRRVLEMATEVVDSATNPLLRIPEELAKPPLARRRGRLRAGWQPDQP